MSNCKVCNKYLIVPSWKICYDCAKHRKRMKTCKLHEVNYNPETSGKCPLCILIDRKKKTRKNIKKEGLYSVSKRRSGSKSKKYYLLYDKIQDLRDKGKSFPEIALLIDGECNRSTIARMQYIHKKYAK